MSFFYILEINPLSVVSFAIIFSHSEDCLFTFFIVSFVLQKLLSLIRAHFFTFVFISLFTFMHWRRKWQPTPVSCLKNPRNGGAWWAATYAVAQSQTQLKRLSSSSSSSSSSRRCVIEDLALIYVNECSAYIFF